MLDIMLGVAIGIFLSAAALALMSNKCPASNKRHCWLYYGPTDRPAPEKYWDRKCINCGTFD